MIEQLGTNSHSIEKTKSQCSSITQKQGIQIRTTNIQRALQI